MLKEMELLLNNMTELSLDHATEDGSQEFARTTLT